MIKYHLVVKAFILPSRYLNIAQYLRKNMSIIYKKWNRVMKLDWVGNKTEIM
jgi:hypothetical protein